MNPSNTGSALGTFLVHVPDAVLEPAALDPEQIIEGSPQVTWCVLDTSLDGAVERGIWQMTPGVVTDVELDEMFFVLEGRATIEFKNRDPLEIGAGDLVIVEGGAETIWHVHETIRKVWQVTHPRGTEPYGSDGRSSS